jgi:hypothetical protein
LSQFELIDTKTGETSVLTDDPNVSEIVWLGTDNTSLLYINATNAEADGGVSLWVTDSEDFASG